jgi:four helix bundle protein
VELGKSGIGELFMEYKYSFEKLDVWNLSKEFVKHIYNITRKFPDEEKFGLVSQLRRAGISIVSNIAEGSTRLTPKDKARFYQIAYGSLIEIIAQLIICKELNYISEDDIKSLKICHDEIANKLNSLHKKTIRRFNGSTTKRFNNSTTKRFNNSTTKQLNNTTKQLYNG